MDKKQAIKRIVEKVLESNRKKFPSMPESARVIPKYTDQNTNGLTKLVKDYLKACGHHVERTGNQGRVIDQTKKFTDVLGFERKIGSIKWIKSSNKKSTSDLKAAINGRFVAIEIKCKATRDSQSDEQKDYQTELEATGGVYVIVETAEGFIEWYDGFVKNLNI